VVTFSTGLIQVTVWIYARFTLSLRDVEEHQDPVFLCAAQHATAPKDIVIRDWGRAWEHRLHESSKPWIVLQFI